MRYRTPKINLFLISTQLKGKQYRIGKALGEGRYLTNIDKSSKGNSLAWQMRRKENYETQIFCVAFHKMG